MKEYITSFKGLWVKYNKYLKLFKGLWVADKSSELDYTYISKGVIFERSVTSLFSVDEINKIINYLIKSNSEFNNTFHKSWNKIATASIEQLIIEQVIHYFTTYGLERIGMYNEDYVYIPIEQSEIPEEKEIPFFLIKGLTKEEITEKINILLESGIALSEDDLTDLVEVIKEINCNIRIYKCKNKEMRVRLYALTDTIPEDAEEFLRLVIYKITGSSLLIKDKQTIDSLKICKINILKGYINRYGYEKLASIFYRHKPIFLALKNKMSNSTINRIRKLAKKHHKPMKKDFISSITEKLKDGCFNLPMFLELEKELEKVNIFRKIRLLQALRLYRESKGDFVYKIRNGKSYVTTKNQFHINIDIGLIIYYVEKSIRNEFLPKVKDKKIFIDSNIAFPTSGKQFYGELPFGSFFVTPKDVVVGISWKDTNTRVDLDFSVVGKSGKIGWDGYYRSSDCLFSGDITAAPNGATEAFYMKDIEEGIIYTFNLNYYNHYDGNEDVPYTIFVSESDSWEKFEGKRNYLIDRNDFLFFTDSKVSPKNPHKVCGIFRKKDGLNYFYLFEYDLFKNMSVKSNDILVKAINYYDTYLESIVTLKEVLENSGAIFVNDPYMADIDLSLKSLTKDKLISLITN